MTTDKSKNSASKKTIPGWSFSVAQEDGRYTVTVGFEPSLFHDYLKHSGDFNEAMMEVGSLLYANIEPTIKSILGEKGYEELRNDVCRRSYENMKRLYHLTDDELLKILGVDLVETDDEDDAEDNVEEGEDFRQELREELGKVYNINKPE